MPLNTRQRDDVITNLHMFCETGFLSDVTIHVDDVMFPCHRLVLAAGSHYFRRMFSSGMAECTTKDIHLKNMDSKIFRHTLNFIYTGHINFDIVDARDMLIHANVYEHNALEAECLRQLTATINLENCVETLCLADLYACEKLKDSCLGFISEHSTAFLHGSDILSISPRLFCDVLRDRRLDSLSEEDIYRNAVEYLDNQEDSNPNTVDPYQVLECVKFHFISDDFLQNTVMNSYYYENSEKLRELVATLLSKRNGPSTNDRLNSYHRTVRSNHDVILFGDRTIDRYSGYLQQAKEDAIFCPFVGGFEFALCCAVSTKLYITGVGDLHSELWIFDTGGNRWSQGANLQSERRMHALAAFGGNLYALGGLGDDNTPHSSVEIYNTQKDEWIEHENVLPMPLWLAGCAALGQQVYLFGGRTPVDDWNSRDTNTIMRYSCDANTTTVLNTQFPADLSDSSATVLNSHIFIICRDNFYDFDPATESLTTLPFPHGHFTYPCLTSLTGKLHVFGGRDVYCRDSETNTWTVVASFFDKKKFTCAVRVQKLML